MFTPGEKAWLLSVATPKFRTRCHSPIVGTIKMAQFAQQSHNLVFNLELIDVLIIRERLQRLALLGYNTDVIVLTISGKEIESILLPREALQELKLIFQEKSPSITLLKEDGIFFRAHFITSLIMFFPNI